MMGYWISFAAILLFVPLVLLGAVVWLKRKKSFSIIQQKNVKIRFIKCWLLYWLCDFFYMACFINNLICKYAFGLTIAGFALISLVVSLNSVESKSILEKVGMVQDFLIGMGLTIYLIYIIPEPSLQTIVTAVVAAVYGGLITLAGVAWTIHKSDRDRKYDEIQKAKPVFSFNSQFKISRLDGSKKACFSPIEGESNFSCEVYVEIENSNKSPFAFNRLFHDGKWFPLEGNTTVLPSGKCYFVFGFSDPLNIVLSVKDSIGKEYLYLLEVVPLVTGGKIAYVPDSNKIFQTLRGIKEISKEDFENLLMNNKQDGAEENGNE